MQRGFGVQDGLERMHSFRPRTGRWKSCEMEEDEDLLLLIGAVSPLASSALIAGAVPSRRIRSKTYCRTAGCGENGAAAIVDTALDESDQISPPVHADELK